MFFGITPYNSLSCPVSTCKNKLIKINNAMDFIIMDLNKNGYPVINASLESDAVYIMFDRKCRFQRLPKSFDMNGVEHEGETVILINYSEPNLNKTTEELNMIANNLSEWVKSFCKG
jgi:hypothetical protein